MRRIWQIVSGPFKRYSLQDWLWFILPVIIFLSLLLGSGPQLQDSIGRSIGGLEPGQQQAIARLPSLAVWLLGAILHPYALISVASLVIALRREFIGEQALSLAFWLGTLLTVSDALIVALQSDAQIQFPQTILYNFAGGLAVAGAYYAAVSVYVAVYLRHSTNRIKRRVLPALYTITIGFISSTIIYMFIAFAFQPSRSAFYAEFGKSASAFIVSDRARALQQDLPHSSDVENDRSFSQFPGDHINGALRVTNVGDRIFSTTWNSLDKNSERSVDIRAFLDCPFRNVEALPKGGTVVEGAELNSVAINVNGGNAEILSAISGYVAVYGDSIHSVTTGESEKTRLRSISGYVSRDVGVRYRTSNDISFLIGASLMESDRRTATPENVVFSLSLDGKRKEWIFKADVAPRINDRLFCRPITFGSTSDTTSIDSGRAYVSLLITVRTVVRAPEFRSEAQELHLRSIDGWVELDEVPLRDIQNESLGKFSGLFGQSGMMRLELSGKPVDVRLTDTLHAVGTFRGYYGEDGNLTVLGETYAIWRNGVRTNLTRWELLPSELQAALIAALVAALGACAAVLRRRVGALGALNRRSVLSL